MKKAIPKLKQVITYQYEIQCPYCKTFLQGGFSPSSIVYKCANCGKHIAIDWINGILVNSF